MTGVLWMPTLPTTFRLAGTMSVMGTGVTEGDGPPADVTSFVAGFSDTWAVTEHTGRQHGVRVDLTALLFGDILAASWADVWSAALGSGLVLGLLAATWRGLVAGSVDEDLARAEGVRVGALSILFMLLVAATVALAMEVVGVLHTLLQKVSTAERSSGILLKHSLVRHLEHFREETMHFLMYKDWGEFGRYVDDVKRAFEEMEEFENVLHEFSQYLRTLIHHVGMREALRGVQVHAADAGE